MKRKSGQEESRNSPAWMNPYESMLKLFDDDEQEQQEIIKEEEKDAKIQERSKKREEILKKEKEKREKAKRKREKAKRKKEEYERRNREQELMEDREYYMICKGVEGSKNLDDRYYPKNYCTMTNRELKQISENYKKIQSVDTERLNILKILIHKEEKDLTIDDLNFIDEIFSHEVFTKTTPLWCKISKLLEAIGDLYGYVVRNHYFSVTEKILLIKQRMINIEELTKDCIREFEGKDDFKGRIIRRLKQIWSNEIVTMSPLEERIQELVLAVLKGDITTSRKISRKLCENARAISDKMEEYCKRYQI